MAGAILTPAQTLARELVFLAQMVQSCADRDQKDNAVRYARSLANSTQSFLEASSKKGLTGSNKPTII